jgi:hypothetical protein
MESARNERERLAALRRRWRAAQFSLMRRGVLEGDGVHRVTEVVVTCLVVSVAPVDGALWGYSDPVWRLFQLEPTRTVAALGAGLCAASAVSLNLLLAWRMPDEGRYRRWVLLLRFLAGGVPLLGVYVVPLWEILRVRLPRWALRPDPPPERPAPLSTGGSWLAGSSLSARFYASSWFGLVGHGALPLLLAASSYWLVMPALSSLAARAAARPAALWSTSLALHLLIAVPIVPYLRHVAARRRLDRRRTEWVRALAILWLLPIPYLGIAGFLLAGRLSRESPGAATFLHHALRRRDDAGRLPAWLALEETLRRDWGSLPWPARWLRPPGASAPAAEPTDAERRLLRVYDLKIFLLGLDAAAVSWWLSRRQTTCGAVAMLALALGSCGALALCAFGLVLRLVHGLALFFRASSAVRALDRHPYARYLVASQGAWVLGTMFGIWTTLGNGPMAAGVVGLAVMIYGLRVARAVSSSPFTDAGRVLAREKANDKLLPLFFVGFYVALAFGMPRTGIPPTALLTAWLLLSPWIGLLLVARLSAALLRPFDWRDFAAPDLPDRGRRALLFLVATLALPLGGLYVPLWIEARHRLWPALERAAACRDAVATGPPATGETG